MHLWKLILLVGLILAGLTPQARAGHVSSDTLLMTATSRPTAGETLEVVGHVGSAAQVVRVRGPYAYVSLDHEFAILDVTDPTRPRRVGFLTLRAAATQIELVGDYAYLGASGLSVIDVSDPTEPVLVAALHRDAAILDLEIANGYAYLIEQRWQRPTFYEQLFVADISNPAAPVPAGEMGWSEQGSLEVVGAYAYAGLATEERLQVLDVSDPANIVEVTRFGTFYPSEMASAGDYLYALDHSMTSGNTTLRILDISEPQAPEVVGSLATEGFWPHLVVDGHVATLISHDLDARQTSLMLVDVSAPAAPASEETVYLEGLVLDLAVDERLAVTTGPASVAIVDISDPDDPSIIGTYGIILLTMKVDVVDHHAFVAAGTDGLQVLDISNPAEASVIGALSVPGFASTVTVADRYAYLGVGSVYSVPGEESIRIIDISVPTALTETSVFELPGSPVDVAVATSGDGVGGPPPKRQPAQNQTRAYVSSSDCPPDPCTGRVLLLDVSDPTEPAQLGKFDVYGPVNFDVSGNHLLVTTDSVQIMDVSNPSSPRQVGTTWGDDTTDIVVSGTLAYITSISYPNPVFHIIDISNPAQPAAVAAYPLTGVSVAVSGHYAYVLGVAGLRVLDVSDPAAPTEVASLPWLSGYQVTVQGNHVYVAGGEAGLYLLQFTRDDPEPEQGLYLPFLRGSP